MDFRLLACWSCIIMEPYFSKIALSLRFLFIATAAFQSRPNLWSGRIQGHEWLRNAATFYAERSTKRSVVCHIFTTAKYERCPWWGRWVVENIEIAMHLQRRQKSRMRCPQRFRVRNGLPEYHTPWLFQVISTFWDWVKWCQHLSTAIQHQLGGRDLVQADATNSAT